MVAQLPVMLSLQPQSGAIEEEKQVCVKAKVPAAGGDWMVVWFVDIWMEQWGS